ncbi:MAG: type I-F CRISPR-associated protein Csy1 [Methylotenera sp.]|nr:type I-F CRISPR-associated protein Csy1 [Methylotenera sp.]
MDAIHQFFADRKTAWLKAKGKSDATDEEKSELEQQASERFALASWLPDAAKRASQLSIVSHPSKFSHPSAKTTPIIAKATPKADGYLRTGNVEYPLDVFGNAAAMDVYKFLSLPMLDGRMVLEHLEGDTPEVKAILDIPTANYDTLKEGFLSVKQSEGNKTYSDRLVKQVYFPVAANQYHLLSLLTPSGVISKLKGTIDAMRFSEQASEARDCRRNGLAHETGYDDVLNLTVTAYGGTQPQNVSVLNSQNAGRAYLLMSAPPTIEKRSVRLPKNDFFSQSLRSRLFKEPMHELHKLMALDINNIKIRTAISNLIIYIVKMVAQEAESIRDADVGWSAREHYQGLEACQRIWLDNVYLSERSVQNEWLEKLARQFSQWFMAMYKTTLSAEAIILSDHELLHVEGFIVDVLNEDEELLK